MVEALAPMPTAAPTAAASRSTALDLVFSLNAHARALDAPADTLPEPAQVRPEPLVAVPSSNADLAFLSPEATSPFGGKEERIGPASGTTPVVWSDAPVAAEHATVVTPEHVEPLLALPPMAQGTDGEESAQSPVQAAPTENTVENPPCDWLAASVTLCSFLALAHWYPRGTARTDRRHAVQLNLDTGPSPK
jgi:hypothetical protein